MSDNSVRTHTGGCQCGAIRYSFNAEPEDAHICHCRMCQKAFGNFFAPLFNIPQDQLKWTRGSPAVFESSNLVERGFCSACGTPLTFRYKKTDRLNLSIGSLDDPASVKPVKQYGVESRMPWFAELASLHGSVTEDDMPAGFIDKLRSGQHPDHD